MRSTLSPVIKCPICDAHGSLLRHDVRAVLVYSCLRCLHEWQIDAEDEPAPAGPAVAEDPQRSPAGGKPSHQP